MKFPVDTKWPVTQKWGENRAYYSQPGLNMLGHNGWDIGVPLGTPVYAAHDGNVWFAGKGPDESLQVAIDTEDGLLRSFYGHLSSYSVSPGQSVKCGDQIGLSGNSGRFTEGPHLHFGVHHIKNFSDTEPNNGWNGACDPAPYLNGLTRNLYLGCSGEDVRVLQDYLKKYGYLNIATTTQFFGLITMKAVIAFQRANNLTPAVGQIGPLSRGFINKIIL